MAHARLIPRENLHRPRSLLKQSA